MTKTIIVVVIGLIAVGAILFIEPDAETYQKPVVATSTVEVVEPEWATDEDAVKAAQDVIKRKELEKRQAELEAQIEVLETELNGVEKELGVY